METAAQRYGADASAGPPITKHGEEGGREEGGREEGRQGVIERDMREREREGE